MQLRSRDPLRPGVLVLEQRPAAAAVPEITLRLGSLANQRTERGATEVRGGYPHDCTWTPGAWELSRPLGERRSRNRVKGHFCAARVAQRT